MPEPNKINCLHSTILFGGHKMASISSSRSHKRLLQVQLTIGVVQIRPPLLDQNQLFALDNLIRRSQIDNRVVQTLTISRCPLTPHYTGTVHSLPGARTLCRASISKIVLTFLNKFAARASRHSVVSNVGSPSLLQARLQARIPSHLARNT